MYAIISEGGRQLKVTEGEEIVVDYRDVPAGEKVTFERVLAVSDGSGDLKLGGPLVKGASVVAEVIGPEQGQKITVQKFRRRKNYRRRTGHRSLYTKVRISRITG
jgi:large subunit ribosomal protein L21